MLGSFPLLSSDVLALIRWFADQAWSVTTSPRSNARRVARRLSYLQSRRMMLKGDHIINRHELGESCHADYPSSREEYPIQNVPRRLRRSFIGRLLKLNA